MFLIEILLGIAILSAVVLVVAVFYSSSTRALTGFRARRDAIGYAQAELSHWQALARIGAVDPASGLPVARGYASIVADGLEHGVDYPRALMGAEGSGHTGMQLTVFRTVVVSTCSGPRATSIERTASDAPRVEEPRTTATSRLSHAAWKR